jgi:hypothetical protein
MSSADTSVDLDRYTKILSRTPDLLRTLLECIPDAVLEATHGPGTWSARQVMEWLIHEEQHLWIPCVCRIIDGGEVLAPEFFDPTIRVEHFRNETPAELVSLFASLREANLAKLRSTPLEPNCIARHGRHPMLGLVTLPELLTTWMMHDLCHVANVCKAIVLPCSQEAGPWRTYLSILMPPIEERRDKGES